MLLTIPHSSRAVDCLKPAAKQYHLFVSHAMITSPLILREVTGLRTFIVARVGITYTSFISPQDAPLGLLSATSA